MGKKRTYSAEFKSKVAIEAIKGAKGTAEICSEFNIPATNLYEWRDIVLGNADQLFISEIEHIRKQKVAEQEIEKLQRIIGEITIENNFFKKKLKK